MNFIPEETIRSHIACAEQSLVQITPTLICSLVHKSDNFSNGRIETPSTSPLGDCDSGSNMATIFIPVVSMLSPEIRERANPAFATITASAAFLKPKHSSSRERMPCISKAVLGLPFSVRIRDTSFLTTTSFIPKASAIAVAVVCVSPVSYRSVKKL